MKWLALIPLLLASTATAQVDGFKGEIALNGSRTTGNTDTTDIGGEVKLAWRMGDWQQKLKSSGQYAIQNDSETKQVFRLAYQVDRDFTERLYALATADYFQDDFGAYKYGYFAGGGLGYRVLVNEPVTWDIEGGPGYRKQKTRENANIAPGLAFMIEEEAAFRAASDFQWQINDNVSAFNLTELTTSSSDTYIWNDIGITADLFGNIAARASFRVDYHTDVPVGREKTDTLTKFGVVYKIQ